jgi:hypothetical protein
MKQKQKKKKMNSTLQAITVLSLFTNNIEDRIDELSAFSVMAFSPVVSSARLAENEVVRPEDLAVGTRSNTVHGTRLKIHENSARYIPPTACFIVVHVNPFKLQF